MKITKKEQIEIGMVVYEVIGLGKDSFISAFRITSLPEEKVIENEICCFVDCIRLSTSHTTKIFLGDVNIGKHHNHCYLFTEEKEAQEYLGWAKSNTKDLNNNGG